MLILWFLFLQKDAILENIRGENEQLNGELQRLQQEIQLLQSARDASVSEARALKIQLDERFLVTANTPSIVAAVRRLSSNQQKLIVCFAFASFGLIFIAIFHL